MYFTREQVEELTRGHREVHGKFADLLPRYLTRTYRDDGAKEYATHGFGRRLGTLVRCIDRVYEILPPDREDIPERDEVIDAMINIQAFMFNIFGCCENLAWMWVFEKSVLRDDGRPLEPKMIGLGEAYRHVRRSFSQPFKAYLDSRRDWFTHIKEFRDALAHRISLYIPPYVITPKQMEEYKRVEVAAVEAFRRRDFAGYDRLMGEQQALGTFRPWMTHSLFQNAPTVLFHPQMLADFNTIDEIGRNLLEEMDR